MALAKFKNTGNGGFFKPADHVNALAFLVEPRVFEADRPIPNSADTSDTIFGDITVFPNAAALSEGGTPHVMEGVGFGQTVLVKDAKPYIGQAFAAGLGKGKSSKAQAPWIWTELDAETEAAVEAYLERRDKALASAMEDAPSF